MTEAIEICMSISRRLGSAWSSYNALQSSSSTSLELDAMLDFLERLLSSSIDPRSLRLFFSAVRTFTLEE